MAESVIILVSVACLALLSAVLVRQRLALRAARVRQTDLERRVADVAAADERHAAILRGTPDGYFVLDADGTFVEVNAAFARLIGYTPDELRKMRVDDIELGDALDAGEGVGEAPARALVTAHRRKDGRVVHLETCVFLVPDPGGRRLIGFARDATQRVQVEHLVRQSEVRYRNLVETSTDLIWVLDLEGRWTFVNSAARHIYGFEPAALIGRSVFEFVHPDLRERARETFSALCRGEARTRFESQHLRRDGSVVHLSINSTAFRDESGAVIGVTGTSTDISHRRETEERLRAAHARFESLVSGMPLGYIVWTEDGRIIEWNPAAGEIFGYREEEVLGRSATEVIVPSETTEAFSRMIRMLRTGAVGRSTILVNRHHNGEKIACEWYCTALPDTLGGGRVVATLVRDVSERERLETQLRQSQRLESLGVLAGGIAHDFNNLLVGIMGNASLAIETLPYDSPLRPMLERVVNAGRRATDLTQRMLAYAGRATCDVEVTDLNNMVAELAVFASAAIPKNVSLAIHTAPSLPMIEADGAQMQQVIMNLLINAAEAIGDRPGEVGVSTWVEQLDEERIASDFASQSMTAGRYVAVEVKDTGCGMPPEVAARIFEPFFTTKFAGRGLGLSAILGIVRAHRGAIFFQSVVGQGTVFRVYFPAMRERRETREGADETAELAPGSTVLVIDDEEDVRDVVQAVLERRGVEVLSAADGPSGVALFREHHARIDVVLLDINMPGMSGESVFRELRRIHPAARVVLSTGYSEQEAAAQFPPAEIAGFVPKPYTASALVERLGAAARPRAGVAAS